MHPRLLLALALGAGPVACAAQEPAPPAPPAGSDVTAYMPLEVGNVWTYAVRFPGQSGERTVRITHRDDEGFFVDDAGGAFRVTPSGLRDRKRYLIRTPVEPGRTWKAVVSAGAVERYRIDTVGASCSAQAGRFEDCLIVRSRLRRDDRVSLEVVFSFARGVGLVKVETIAHIAGKGAVPQTEQSLVAYRVGGGPDGAAASDDRHPEPEAVESDPSGPDTWGR